MCQAKGSGFQILSSITMQVRHSYHYQYMYVVHIYVDTLVAFSKLFVMLYSFHVRKILKTVHIETVKKRGMFKYL